MGTNNTLKILLYCHESKRSFGVSRYLADLWPVVNTVMELWVPRKAGNFLTS